jgi:hypothetical protein
MKTILRITFSCGRFNDIIIENPGFLPSHGEVFYCKWGDFIEDKDKVKQLDEIEEEDCWMVQRAASTYSKDVAECHIVLHSSENFKNSFN